MENNQLTDHAYDGIQEYDNPLPGWWKALFIGSVVYSFGYLLWYHTGNVDRTLEAQYQAASEALMRIQFEKIGELTGDEITLVKYANEEDWLKVGAGVYRTNCISCHGRNGEGSVGPNLTDELYKYVRKPEDVFAIINKGAGNGAMPAWASRLGINERVLVSSYVMSLRGKNLDGKAADGQEIAPWPAPPPKPEEDSETKK
jgi:cytochrome c oxidase cbb3-type subunit III